MLTPEHRDIVRGAHVCREHAARWGGGQRTCSQLWCARVCVRARVCVCVRACWLGVWVVVLWAASVAKEPSDVQPTSS